MCPVDAMFIVIHTVFKPISYCSAVQETNTPITEFINFMCYRHSSVLQVCFDHGGHRLTSLRGTQEADTVSHLQLLIQQQVS